MPGLQYDSTSHGPLVTRKVREQFTAAMHTTAIGLRRSGRQPPSEHSALFSAPMAVDVRSVPVMLPSHSGREAIMVGNRRSPSDTVLVNPLPPTIHDLYTLGPSGTNCEAAARHWLSKNTYYGANVKLFETLEDAVTALPYSHQAALLGCVVYPDLHSLVFANMRWLVMVDAFIYPTYPMVLATQSSFSDTDAKSIACHPAPQPLVPDRFERIDLESSNTAAADSCSSGVVDACITTEVAAKQRGLRVSQDFGPIDMGFTVHAQSRSLPK